MRKEQEHIVEGATRTTAFLLRACVSQTLYQCAIWAGPFQTTVAAHTDVSTLPSFIRRFELEKTSWRKRVGEDELEKTSWRKRVGEDELEKTSWSGTVRVGEDDTCKQWFATSFTGQLVPRVRLRPNPIGFTRESPKNSNHPPQKYSSSPARVHSFPNFGGFSYGILRVIDISSNGGPRGVEPRASSPAI